MERVLIRKSDGYPVEHQSKHDLLGTLMKNSVIKYGFNSSDYEEKYITAEDYAILAEEKINKPLREARKEKKDKARQRIKAKFNFNDNDLEDLRDAL